MQESKIPMQVNDMVIRLDQLWRDRFRVEDQNRSMDSMDVDQVSTSDSSEEASSIAYEHQSSWKDPLVNTAKKVYDGAQFYVR